MLLLLTAAFIVLAPIAAAAQPHMEACHGSHRVSCVVDGDTLWLRSQKLRLKGYDAPETTTNVCGSAAEIALGHRARDRLIVLLNASDWTVEFHGKESRAENARELVTIRVGGRDVGRILVGEGLARRWPDGPEWWCD